MRVYDIIAKKRDGKELTQQEIEVMVSGYTGGTIPDYQMSAFLMAVFLKGMTAAETAQLTDSMARSGDMVDLSGVDGITVDKHSTGGVGDKTTLVVAPLAAACGLKVAKMSGRALGHSGGTVDKMEAIPGMKVELPQDEFIKQVNKIGLALVGQSGNLAPADKKIYALRDVTATVNSLPLIASSIMSKKLAAGAGVILLDVKTGGGAFMKTLDDSIALAKAMVDIGEHNGRNTAAIVSDMDVPLGRNIGNSLEVAEAVETLQGNGPEDLTQVCLELTADLLELAGHGSKEACMEKAKEALDSGAGLAKLRQMVAEQGGDVSVIDNPRNFAKAQKSREILAEADGYIAKMDTEKIGMASMVLGAGRETKEDSIDYAAGIRLCAKTGDLVKKGEILAILYSSSEEKLNKSEQMYTEALAFTKEKPSLAPLIQARVSKAGVVRY